MQKLKKEKVTVKFMSRPVEGAEIKAPRKIGFLDRIRQMYRHPLIVGIDISDHSIEILQLDPQKNIKLYARRVLEKGIVEDAKIKDANKLGEAFNKVLKEAGIDVLMEKEKVRIKGLFSFPESKTFIRVFEFEGRKDLKEKIAQKIRENIPIPFEELYWDYYELSGRPDRPKILIVAVPKEVIDEYVYFFWTHYVDPVVFDTEAASIGRALLPQEEQESSTVIVDIGARITVINIFNPKNELSLSLVSRYAGNYFTQTVAKKLEISEEEAEKIKKESGFEKEPVASILKECAQVLVKEIKDALKYYQNRFQSKVGKIILAGGSSLLPKIREYFQENFKEKVELGQPLQKIGSSYALNPQKAILFATVIGLALRGLQKDFINSGINLLPEEIKKQERVLQKERERFVRYIIFYFFLSLFVLLLVFFVLFRLGVLK
jgi:type IV pilus assembly protein PilM